MKKSAINRLRMVATFSALLLVMNSLATGLACAQQTRDRQPPVIEHQAVSASAPAMGQLFTATVTDNIQVAQVILHYRFKGQQTYLQKKMVELSNSTYAASVGTSPDSTLAIEYFIRATDSAGIAANHGFAYLPLIRSINTSAASAPATFESAPKTTLTRKLLYVAGAALVGGIVANVINDSSGDADDTSAMGQPTVLPVNDECQSNTCPLVFVLPIPQ